MLFKAYQNSLVDYVSDWLGKGFHWWSTKVWGVTRTLAACTCWTGRLRRRPSRLSEAEASGRTKCIRAWARGVAETGGEWRPKRLGRRARRSAKRGNLEERNSIHLSLHNALQSPPLSDRLPFCPRCMRIDSRTQIATKIIDSRYMTRSG